MVFLISRRASVFIRLGVRFKPESSPFTCRKEGMTVVVITHNTALTPMADRVIHIKSGKVAAMERNEHPTPVEQIEW